jgi:hypothetical protein
MEDKQQWRVATLIKSPGLEEHGSTHSRAQKSIDPEQLPFRHHERLPLPEVLCLCLQIQLHLQPRVWVPLRLQPRVCVALARWRVVRRHLAVVFFDIESGIFVLIDNQSGISNATGSSNASTSRSAIQSSRVQLRLGGILSSMDLTSALLPAGLWSSLWSSESDP